MKGSRFTTEQIIMKLREMEIHISQGMSVSEAVRHIGISDATYYKWRSKYENMTTSDAKRLKDLEIENNRLKRLVADLSLENAILKDVNQGKF
jgi:transposase-like protein